MHIFWNHVQLIMERVKNNHSILRQGGLPPTHIHFSILHNLAQLCKFLQNFAQFAEPSTILHNTSLGLSLGLLLVGLPPPCSYPPFLLNSLNRMTTSTIIIHSPMSISYQRYFGEDLIIIITTINMTNW